MKSKILLLLTVCQVITAVAQKKNPKWVDIANKAIVTVETTTKEGTVRTGPCFFISENGETIAAYELFRKADKAVVITVDGKRLPVTHIIGADEIYNVIRFKVTVPKKTAFLSVSTFLPAINSMAILPASNEIKELAQGVVSEITKISNTFDYYKIDMPLPSMQVGFPLLTQTGEVFAITQPDASGKGKTYGLSIAYIQNLQATTSDMFKKTFTDISIRKTWASSKDDAQLALILYSSQQDAPTYLETINDFIATFPNDEEGYIKRASHYAYLRKELASTQSGQMQLLDKALIDLDYAAKITKKKGEGLYNKAKLIFGIVASDSTLSYKNWNLKTAEENIQKALKENNTPAYRQLEGDIAFFQNDFEKAFKCYMVVNNSPDASGASYYFAAKCKQQIEGSEIKEIITLLDSAIAKSPPLEAAAYLLENIELKLDLELFDQVIKDYDKYLVVSGGNVSEAFYYYREQAKIRTNDIEGALKDITMAITLDNNNALYFAEQASIYLRMNEAVKAQISIVKALQLDPEFSAAYRILGVSLVRQDKKAEACNHFIRAKELGDPVAERLINEHCKE